MPCNYAIVHVYCNFDQQYFYSLPLDLLKVSKSYYLQSKSKLPCLCLWKTKQQVLMCITVHDSYQVIDKKLYAFMLTSHIGNGSNNSPKHFFKIVHYVLLAPRVSYNNYRNANLMIIGLSIAC